MTHKKIKREVELPSFLLDLNVASKEGSFLPKATNSSQYLGPLFFGQCHQFHPPLHSFDFSSFRPVKKAYFAKENIKDLLLEKKEEIKKRFTRREIFKSAVKRKKIYSESYKHKASGTRRAFVPEVGPHKIDLGETTSVIEGETTLEIPLYRLKKGSSGTTETEFELVMLSDIKEKKRFSMPYKERISHIHFPKKFVKVAVIGPTVPAAITITKLPSKRKTEFEMSLLIKSQDGKSSKQDVEKNKEKIQVVGGTESEVISSNEEQAAEITTYDTNEENAEVDETTGEGGSREFNSEMNLTDIEEETPEVREEKVTEETGETDNAEELLPQGEKEENIETDSAEGSLMQGEKGENMETDSAEVTLPQDEEKNMEKNESIEEKEEENPKEPDV